ncbi:MAG: CusA/CzcA family heavy metal efflux RND transporter [Acidobacteriota bacterium]|nr:CusA/CzcA family heavy metal efflux RND transporter [Acidobacteriota bacterium]MDQ7086479.1 CusA/CzcA family heavy metal efflux RND transporter [Acidobacteriota bacterium]
MIHAIIDFSLNNRFLVIVSWLLLAVVGVFSLNTLPIDAVPDVTNIQVQVLTNSPGLGPEEVERFITFPVETAMSGLPRVEEIRSVSKFGLSLVTVVFEEGSDIYWARQLVAERLTAAREQIPDGYGEPEMGPISTGLGEIYQFEVRGEPMCGPEEPDTDACYTPMELRTILDWFVNYQLRSVPGIVEVNSFGGELKTYQVSIDPLRLTAYGLSLAEVFDAIEANNRNVGGGYIAHQGEQYLIRGEGLVASLEDIGLIVLAHDRQGTPVYVSDIAEVEFAPMIRQGAVTRDGRGEAVVGIVMMLMGENSRVVVDHVKQKIEAIKKTLPEGVTIETFYDRTDLVRRTIKTVAKNLIEGGALVIVILLLLLGNLRGGLIVSAAIPLSMLVAFTAMRFAGLSGNLMSLGAIDFGLIVDGSVVMIENIVRVLHSRRHETGVPHIEKVRAAAHQVARPVVFAVGIIMIVYLPILALRGVEGKMFRPMALTVVFALAASLVCAMTLMPVLASLLIKKVSEKEPLLFRMIQRLYKPLLQRALRWKIITATIALTLFVASLGVIPFLGAEFIPRLDEGAIAMQIWRPPSISLEESNRVSLIAEKVILEQFPEVETVVSRTGRAEIATDPMGVEISDTYLILKPPKTWRFKTKEKLIQAIDAAMKENVPGAIFSFSQPIELRVQELIAGVRSDIAVHIYGDDLKLMKRKADEVVAVLQKIPGAADVKAEQTVGLPMLNVRVDREAIARHGINAQDVLDVVETIGGKSLGVVLEGQKRFVLQVRFAADNVRQSLDQVRNLRVRGPAEGDARARLIPLSQLADISIEDGSAQISRENISRRINVESNVRGRDLASFVKEARAAVERDVELPPGWLIEWGGQFENLQAATRRLTLLVPLALLMIFVLLYSTFNSGRLAILIFTNVPLAVTGGLLALALRGYPFSISAGVGFIALFGVAVLNGVVLISYVEQKRREGADPEHAAIEGASVRLRPVLMTAMVASLGFLPMAMATSAGAEVQRPLATVVIGGLVTSTLLTLLVLPTIYSWFAVKRADAGR